MFPKCSINFGIRFDLQTKTKWNNRKTFKYNRKFLRFKKTENGTKRVIFTLGKYYGKGVSRFNFRAFVLSYLH